jgi:acyl-CoA thioester hydrolase
MTRLDRARLDTAEYPVRFSVQTRFDDLDILGHVNNVSVVVFLQEARVDFNVQASLRSDTGGLRMMAVGLVVEFAGEMHYPAPIEVFTGVVAIGRTSFTLGQVVRQEGLTTAYGEATLVFTDAAGPAHIPQNLRVRLEGLTI